MKYIKSYDKQDERLIKNHVDLFVEKVIDGIYLTIKDRFGKGGEFLSQNKLADKLNTSSSVAIKYGDAVIVYSIFLNELDKLIKSTGEVKDYEDYKDLSQSFIGKRMRNMFCNGFFGRDNYELYGAEILRIFEGYENNIVIRVRKRNGKISYGYFDNHWNDWKIVYEYLKEWVDK